MHARAVGEFQSVPICAMFGFGVIVPWLSRSRIRPEIVGWGAEAMVGFRQPIALGAPGVRRMSEPGDALASQSGTCGSERN